jgi:AcrR family transcriptional regulator
VADHGTAARGQNGAAHPSGVRPPGPVKRARRRLSVDQRREELIEAALQLFSHRPAEEVAVDDVAVAAGASRALVYHYFGGKQELYVAALRSAADQLTSLVEPPTHGRPMERLAISLRRYFDFVEDHAAGFVTLLRGGPANRSGEVGQIIDGVRQYLLELLTRELRVEEPSPILRTTLRSWIASVETAGLDWIERKDLARDELERLLIDQHLVLLEVAGRHCAQVNAVLTQLFTDSGAAESGGA